MTLWPTWFESSVCQTPMTPVTIGITTIPATRTLRSLRLSSGIATSSTSRSRNGETTPTAAEKTMSAQTSAETRAVRPEERDDPPEVRLADGRIGGPLRRHRRTRRSRIGVQARP